MKYRSPTAQVKGLGASKHGFSHWWAQRLSAVLLMPTGLFVLFGLAQLETVSPQQMVIWLQSPLNAMFILVFIMTATYHAALGLQVVLEDYIHNHFWQLLLRYFVKLLMLLMTLLAVYSIIKVLFGI